MTVYQHRVPAHMVHMQVRAQNRVNGLGRVSRLSKILQKVRLQMGPVRDVTLLVVANAGINKNPPVARIHHKRMNAHLQVSLLVHEMGLHPRIWQAGLSRRVRQDKARPAKTFDLYNSGNLYITDCPLIHQSTPHLSQ